MDEVWERAVETALDGQTDSSSARSLTLDGAVKCIHGRLPPSGLLERFRSLEHLSIANVGVSSLEKFPHLPNLQKLTLSDNRIAGGLEFLVEAGLASLRDLDLSNNRIQFVEDLAPLAQLRLVSLDLYECPVTRVKDYRSRVFSMIRSLKYLDKMDADENERPESDEEDEEEDEEEEEDDPGSGEVDGEDRSGKPANGGVSEGVVDVDEDEESDADEEETETTRVANGSSRLGVHHLTNGFRVAAAAAPSADGDDVEEDMEDEDEDDLGEEIDEEEGEDDDVVEVHEIDDSDEDEDGVEEDDDDDEEDEEDVDDEEDMEPGTTAQLTSAEGEIDGHEQGEEDENGEIGEEDDQAVEEDGEYEDDDEENGEIGEEDEQGVEENGEYEEEDGEGEDEEEDFGSEYLVRPVRQAEEDAGGSDLDPGNEDEGEEDEVEDEEDKLNVPPQPKRRRPDGSIEDSRPPPKHPKHH